jgi:hypothetical protein
MGTIKTTNIETITGSGTLTLGQSGETITIPSGVTLTNNGTASGFGSPSIVDNGTATAITIDSSNNVGIGTSSPQEDLSINVGLGTTEGLGLQYSNETKGGIKLNPSGGEVRMGAFNSTGTYFTTLYSNNSERMRITSDGRLQLATTSNMPYGGNQVRFSFEFNSSAAPYYGIEMKDNGSAGTTYGILFSRSSLIGSISYNASSVSYNTTSDYRLKNNISDVLNAIDRVKQLKPIRFNFISEPDKTVDGFLAHEVQEVVPEAIVGEKDAVETYIDDDGNEQTRPFYQGIDQSKLVPLLTAGLQEAITKIETLEARITALENK